MKKEKKGKVWIAGAGPGDAGLLTVRTAHLMRQADVIVYDALISAEILSLIPPDTRTIYVGKRSDHHLVPQEEINQILVREAELGNHVLRLKGGDPFVFGRGGEEAQMLRNAGIDFEIVPGVTSGVAVPAYAGIPVTHRDYTSSFHVITGHTRKGGLTRIDYKALVRLGGTLIFLMGVTALPEICTKLREAGMPGETPAAVIQDGTLACQKSVRSDLIHLPEHVLEEKIKAPAIIVVGQVCALGDECSWMKKRPLGGRQILVTRPEERNRSFAESLRSLGAQVIDCLYKCCRRGRIFFFSENRTDRCAESLEGQICRDRYRNRESIGEKRDSAGSYTGCLRGRGAWEYAGKKGDERGSGGGISGKGSIRRAVSTDT